MEYRQLGPTGTVVSRLPFGTMYFGKETSQDEAFAIIDAGGNLIDTSHVYVGGLSQQIVGRWFASRPSDVTDSVVVAAKGRFATTSEPNGPGLSRHALLSGTHSRGEPPTPGTRAGSDKPLYRWATNRYLATGRSRDTIDVLTRNAKRTGAAPTQVALSWTADQPGVVAPFLGARSVQQTIENLVAEGSDQALGRP